MNFRGLVILILNAGWKYDALGEACGGQAVDLEFLESVTRV
jgi:hypothetical protein